MAQVACLSGLDRSMILECNTTASNIKSSLISLGTAGTRRFPLDIQDKHCVPLVKFSKAKVSRCENVYR